MSGCIQETSCLAQSFNSKQNCNKRESQDNLEILEGFSEVSSVGLGDIHFEIVIEGKEVVDACAIAEVQTVTSEQPTCWRFSSNDMKTEQDEK